MSASEHDEWSVSADIGVSDRRSGPVPVPSFIVTFHRTQQSSAAAKTARGCRDNARLILGMK